MAVEAAQRCLSGRSDDRVDALFFASTTAPYAEKSHASLIATACDLKDEISTADFAHTARAGSSALIAALHAVASGDTAQALVTAADCPLAYPKSDQEQLGGDASAAVLIAQEDLVAVHKATFSVNNEILDTWRNYGEIFGNTSEARFASDKGYHLAMAKAVGGLLKKAGLSPKDVGRLVLASPGLKDAAQLGKRLGFAPEQIQDPLMTQVGYCAAAQPLLLLASALEAAAPGDLIVLAAYGTGADAFLFQATDAVSRVREGAMVARSLEEKGSLGSYSRYLSFRGILETLPGEPFRTFPSTSAYWRDQKAILRFHGGRCRKCGTVTAAINRICPNCGAKDDYEEVRLSGRKAAVFSYSVDNLAGRSDDPVVVQTVCEDDEKTRYYLLMTDFDSNSVRVGMPVEFTFRKIYVGGNYINYYWKCRPAVTGGAASCR
ncbi:3-oxoacyl-[acyl-carrier-protein] synthase III C-terminal domain-containing protein [Oleispirillum naphthae]|uniref:3-oxoacyl-[acyl-carrier-protein] synthase III C-terminal domain-containing protein n=1 Tax=Oleispirillum naphthae TaxID=2838853 RepID=UPI0030824997